jgi:cell division septum initiation protein DivIVA
VGSLDVIDRFDELVSEAKPGPRTSEARIDREEAYRLLDELRTTIPVELERSRWLRREDEHQERLEAQVGKIEASIAELRKAQPSQAERPSGPPLTDAAAEQVGEVIEAAQSTASRLEDQAASKARRLKDDAQAESKAAREEAERLRRESQEQAKAEAAAYLRRIDEATKKMLERAGGADSEMNGMLARLRESGGSVIEDLEAIMAGLNEIEVRRSKERREAGQPAEEGLDPTPPPGPDSGDQGESPSQVGARRGPDAPAPRSELW